MVRTFFIYIFFSIFLSAKTILVVPANIDYNDVDLSFVAEELYLAIDQNVIAFNKKQKSASDFLKLKEGAAPHSDNMTLIHKIYSASETQGLKAKLAKKNVDALLTQSFETQSVLKTIQRCQYRCYFNVTLSLYPRVGYPKEKSLSVAYNASTETLSIPSFESFLGSL